MTQIDGKKIKLQMTHLSNKHGRNIRKNRVKIADASCSSQSH